MSSGYCALHNHSEFSYLDGRSRTAEMAAQAILNGDEAVAITDHDVVGGQLNFQEACKAAGIKSVFGTEARWMRDIAKSREAKTGGHDDSHIVLLAENEIGLRNMWALSSQAHEEKYFYNKPQLDPELMAEHSEGLWASDGCALTRFAEFVYFDQEDLARQELAILQGIFGDHFYMELHTWQMMEPSSFDEMKFYGEKMTSVQANALVSKVNQAKVRFASEMGVPLVVVNDAHYARKSQWREHRLVWAMNTYKKDQTEGAFQAADWMMNTDELVYWMGKHGISESITREAIKTSGWIADQCNVEIKPNLEMPRLYKTDAEDREAFLKAVHAGFERKINGKVNDIDKYSERMQYEIDLIIDKKMPGYFNVVADYTMAGKTGEYARWVHGGAQKDPCLCGPGRGSGGGSLVNYLLGITSIDPLRYGLTFERFINPDRMDPPDIDVDFPTRKRQGLLGYVGKRYGEDRVVAIGTRSRSGPAALLADLARSMQGVDGLDIHFADVKAIRELLDEVYGIPDDEPESEVEPPTWDEVLQEMGGELAPYAKRWPLLFERMGQLMGLPRQTGVHAAGILVLNKDRHGNIATARKPGGTGTLSTQFDMHELEWLGGTKDDILGIRHLDTCEVARELVYERHGLWLDFNGDGIGMPDGIDPYDVITWGDEQLSDPEIWPAIWRGGTWGIFQIGTAGATKQAARLRPANERDMSDLIAINRPGVIRAGLLDAYLKRRQGEQDITFDHPLMRTITGETCGILVYQEDLTRCAKEMAQFTPGEGEMLRKVIGKKLMDKMIALEPKFIEGLLTNPDFMVEFVKKDGSYRQEEAEKVAKKIWSSLLASGAYAFNKSHAMGYSLLACWEVWLKHYCYSEWVAACLATDFRKGYPKRYVREARKMGMPILPPDINESKEHFTLVGNSIRYGLTDINGIGDAAVEDIVSKQPFSSIDDYLERCRKDRGAKKNVAESLIKIGAFDSFNPNRAEVLKYFNYWRCLREVAEKKRGKLTREQADEEVAKRQNKPERAEEFRIPRFTDEKVIFDIENDLVGTFITRDPMEPYAETIEKHCISNPIDVLDFEPKQQFRIGGEVLRVSPHMQKNGKQMAFLTITWQDDEYEILAFAGAWADCRPMLKVGAPVVCEVAKLNGSGCNLVTVLRLDWD